MSNPNDEMATTIANLNMTNVAKQVENGINNMSYLNNTQLPPNINTQPTQQPNVMHPQMQQQLQYPQQNISQPQLQMPPMNQFGDINSLPPQVNIPNNEGKSKTKSTLDLLSNNLKEPILIAVVFVVLNHPAFLKAVGKYIPYIVPTENPTMFNLVIRGLMLGSVIVLLNKTVLK